MNFFSRPNHLVALTLPATVLAAGAALLPGATLAAPNHAPASEIQATTGTPAGELAPLVFEELESGEPPELIVQFKTQASQVQSLDGPGRPATAEDKANARAFRALEYAAVKGSALSSFSAMDLEVVKNYSQLPFSLVRVRSPQALTQILQHQEVAAVYQNQRFHPFLAESLPYIHQPEAELLDLTGEGTTVAVLDTGLDFTRSAFGNCTAPGIPDSCKVIHAQDFGGDDGQLDDHPGKHGTNVAGIVLGVAPATRIAALDVFRTASAYTSDILAAVNWAIENQSKYNIVAMNMSFGGGLFDSSCSNSVFTTAFANAREAGIVPVIAAGNNGSANQIASPACVPGAVSVGAVYDSDLGPVGYGSRCSDEFTGPDQLACFSNRASFLTLVAPGVRVKAAGITMSGTSQATPHVSGAIAALQSINAFPDDSPDETIQRLQETGIPVFDPESGQTFFRIDLEAASVDLFQAPPDSDGDGIADNQDNCTTIANPSQLDTDNDLIGNACDPDFNQNGIVDPFDFAKLKACFGSTACPDQDLNGNDIVDPFDFAQLKAMFGKPPGPSGLLN